MKGTLYRLRALNPENYSPGKGKRSPIKKEAKEALRSPTPLS